MDKNKSLLLFALSDNNSPLIDKNGKQFIITVPGTCWQRGSLRQKQTLTGWSTAPAVKRGH